MMTSYAKLLAALVAGEVQFALVGGLACVLHGHVRATEDVDIVVDASAANIARLIDVLSDWEEGWGGTLTAEDFPIEPGAVRIVESFPLDVFTEMSGLTWAEIREHVLWWRSPEFSVPYVDLPVLIATKRLSVRSKDQEDVRVLEGLLRK